MSILFVCFTALLLQTISTDDYSEIGVPVTTIYSPEEHGGANQNWWLTQTANGLIYNGTGTGINEWDGEKWSFYKTPQSTRIRSVVTWTDGNIYVGTANDFGYYRADDRGSLKFTSLIENWNFEQHQFGEIWSVAANDKGVLFSASDVMYFWDGKKVQSISDGLTDANRVFALGNQFIYKRKNNKHFDIVQTQPVLKIEKSDLQLPIGVKVRQVLTNLKNNTVIFTDQFGAYELIDNVLIKQLDGDDFPLDTNIYHAIQAHDGYYYVTSLDHGLFILNKNFKLIRQYTNKHNLGMNTILSVFEDTQHSIWLSGVPNIVKMIPPHVYSSFETDGNSKASEYISLFQNKVTVAGDSLYQIAEPENQLAPYYFKSLTPGSRSVFNFIEYKGYLVTVAEGGIFTQKIVDGQLTNYRRLIDSYLGRSLVIDAKTETLFTTTYEGLYRIVLEGNELKYNLIEGTVDQLEDIQIDEYGTLWIGTATQELYKIDNAQYPDREVKIHKFINVDGLGKNNVIPFKISSGVVFGTNDGLMDYKKGRHPELQFVNGYPTEIFNTKDTDIFRLYEDEQKRLWFRASKKTGYMQKELGNWKVYEDIFRPIKDSGYKGFVVTDSNIVWVTMANGQIFRLNINRMNDSVDLGQLNIRKITSLDTGAEIYGGLTMQDRLKMPKLPLLDQQHNSIRINYALTENVIPEQKTYRYRLIGSNYEKWSIWSSEKHKDFTLLNGNDYQFQLESKDGWGRIKAAQLNFTVSPVWYLSRIAWIVYAVSFLIILIITGWLTQKWRHRQLKLTNIKLEKQVKERTIDVMAQAKELKQQQVLKDRFFTNVSHEFRTPLTLVIAPLTAIINDNPSLDKSILHPIDTALRNSKKMLSLVGEVLDMNKLESGYFSLHIEKYDIAALINNCVKRFNPWAQENNQALMAKNSDVPVLLYFDLDQIERCLSNLLSNAIKYSGKNCQITVSLVKKKHQTGIQVHDNGKGISKEFKDKIFHRYTQDKVSKEDAHSSKPGTGIGLALVSELMKLHHGSVELNNKEGYGCSFILWLKHGHEHFDNSQLSNPIANEIDSKDTYSQVEVLHKQLTKDSEQTIDMTTVLIVDDNQELREFLVSKFSSYYKILEASNGQQGLAIAENQLPDLIISDVMMPIMDGFEMTKKLKISAAAQYIPVILLTAKSTKRETVEGLQSGADDYLTKPFDTSELIVRAIGLINKQKQIREKIQLELSQQVSSVKSSSSFVDALHGEILHQLSSPKLNIETLANALATSRSSLNRKCKDQLDKSPAQFITETRMQHALTLLKTNKHTVSEIAYGVGYESLAGFSKIFKKHFGQNPSSIKN